MTEIPTRDVPGYHSLQEISRSVSTLVRRGIRTHDGMPVVIKCSAREYPSLREEAGRRNELDFLSELDSPHIIRAYGLERLHNQLLLIEEDFAGIPIGELFRTRDVPIASFLTLAIKITDALAAVHGRQIIHKDISPTNILVDPLTLAVKLIDFGLASRLARERHDLKSPGGLQGTLAYISPEQTCRTNRAVDCRSDLYALGATFYHLLARVPPFDETSPLELVHAHIAREPRALAEIAPWIPQVVVEIIQKLMAKSLEARYQSATGVRHDLQRCVGHATAFELAQHDAPTRFEVPPHIWGRDREIEILLDGFARVATGKTELLLIGGYSGIGKSSLVGEVHKPIVQRHGYFISGKYDQYQRSVPYSALGQAFGQMVEMIFTEPAAEVASWRARILEVLGGDGRILTDVIPALEQLIGPQPAVVALPPSEAQSRFRMALQRFVRVFAQRAHPLVLFLDDLQWADGPSLLFLEALLDRTRPPFLYVIAAYRDNEVDPAHPLLLAVQAIRGAEATVHEIVLSPLTPSDAGELIARTLRRTREQTLPLASLLHERTGGNPFFLIQLLHSLHDAKLLRLDPDTSAWTWDFDRILSVGTTTNIIELMTARIGRLPRSCKEVLKAAACIGGAFDLKTLSTVCQLEYQATAQALWPALNEGLITCGSTNYQAADARARRGTGEHSAAIRHELNRQLREEIDAGRFNVRYQFLHDRVQQAAYLLIPDLHRPARHLSIGRLRLQQCTSDAQRDELIFELTSHFNLGLVCVSDPDEQLMIARLNLQAGARAKASVAHREAARYLTIACELLGPAAWDAHYELMLELQTSLAECCYLIGDFRGSEQHSLEAVAHGRSTVDRAKAYATRIQLFMTGSELAKALQAGVEALTQLGFAVPDTEAGKALACAHELARIDARLAGIEIGSLVDLPAAVDPEKLAALDLLVHTWCAAYFARDMTLSTLTVYWLVTTSLDHGHAAASALGYVLHGMLVASAGDYRRGFELGELGKRLNEERFPNPVYRVRVNNMFANALNPYFHHLETNLPYYLSSYQTGPQIGEVLYPLWAVHLMMLTRTMIGDHVGEVLAESDKYLAFIRDTREPNVANAYDLHRQMLRCLQGQTRAPDSLDGEGFDEAERVARFERTGFQPGALWYGAFRAGVHVQLGQYAEALEVALRTEREISYDIGVWSTTTNHYFFQSIAILQVYPDASPAQHVEYDRLLDRNFAKLAQWAANGPVNFRHRHELMLGERARLEHRDSDAVAHYDLSIAGAAAGRFTHDEALALELAGQFYRVRGRDRVARVYLTDAYYAYARWGAVAKTTRMTQELGGFLLSAAEPNRDVAATTDRSDHGLDLVTVLKATQAISSEIVRDKLLTTVMAILTENAGAERGVLLLERDGELIVEVEASGAGSTPVLRPLADYPRVLSSVINLVYRTRRSVVLDDAYGDGRFLNDAYAARVKPRSVLCLPIMNQGRLRGVGYFENNLSCGVFTVDRLAVLELLVTQAAISIENASLYHELESRVQARTEELRQSLDERQLAQVELESANEALRKEIHGREQIELELQLAQKLEAVGRLAAGIAHEINTPIQFIQDNVSFVRDGTTDLLALVGAYRALPDALRALAPPALFAHLDQLAQDADLPFLTERMPAALDQALYGLGRVTTLVRSMKEFAHADRQDKALSDINRALVATLAIAHNEYKYVAEVRTRLGAIPPVRCHISELNQCFLNLIVNASHAIADAVAGSTARGVIEVTSEVDDGLLVVAISDTGGGIPLAIRDKIFDPFFTTKELGRGSGQGLAIARRVIVDKHGGSLSFETELGHGTTFYVRLPLDVDGGSVHA